MKIFKGERPAISEEPDTAEVYEWFGATSFSAQVLEQGILLALVVLDSRCHRVTEEEWDSFYRRYDRATLGKMLRKLGEKHDFPDGYADLLDNALRERNRLAHRFFADNAEALGFAFGRRRMIDDLSAMMDLFYKANAATQKVIEFQRNTLGMTEEVIETLIQHMLAEHLEKHQNG